IALGAGFNFEASTWIGGVMGLGVMTYIEIGDGFGKHWGFSPSDMAANVLGSTFYVAQHYVPVLQNFTPKYTYVDPSWMNQPPRQDAFAFFDNYTGATYWMSMHVHDMLPENIRDVWP